MVHRKFVFARKGFRADDTALVQLRVTIGRKSKFFGTDIHLKAWQWDDVKLVTGHPRRLVMNQVLKAMADKVDEYALHCQHKGMQPTLEGVEAVIKASNRADVVEFAYALSFDDKLQPGTQRSLRSFSSTLRRFGRFSTFDDITAENISLFNDYLFSLGLTTSTVRKRHAYLRRTIRIAQMRGLMGEGDPYRRFQMPKAKEAGRKFLSIEDIEKLKAAELNSGYLERVRDVFLFQCYTGMAHADVKALTRGEILTHSGTTFVVINRIKTGEESAIPLIEQAAAIIEKYAGRNSITLLPVISNQVMNRYLKDVQRIAGVAQTLTTHVARHTFATTITLENDVPIETVSRMLGHARLATTQIYAKITRDKLARDMAKVADKLKK